MIQAPGYASTTQETSRVLTRGQLEFFTWKFFYDQAETQPIQPLDPQAYPSYRILDPSGAILAQGLAVPAGAPGHWKIGWVVPRAAQLTNINRRYQMAAVMVDKEMRQFDLSWEFDVVESAVTPQEPELQQFMTFVNKPIRLFFKNTVRPVDLSVGVFLKGQDASARHTAIFTYPVPATPGPTDIIEFEDGTGFTYYTDSPALAAGSYSALWQVRDTPISQMDYEHQVIQVITTTTSHLINSLRMLVDKLQKKLGLAFAYSNEDLYEYIAEGTKLVNSYWPPSYYSVSAPPASIEAFIVLAGAWWGLNAQRILYAETNLSFSGQTVTLDYNPGADIEGIMSSFKEILDTNVSKVKQQLSRQASGVGSIATRPYRYRTNVVFPVSSGPGQTQFIRLQQLGLMDWLG
jgi:hypothetical protein